MRTIKEEFDSNGNVTIGTYRVEHELESDEIIIIDHVNNLSWKPGFKPKQETKEESIFENILL